MVAYAVHESGHREVIGIDLGETETEAFWVAFLRSLVKRGLAGVRLAVSDHHEGLTSAIARILGCPWQRCTVHFVRNMQGHCRRSERGIVAAALREIFDAEGLEQARSHLGEVLERFRSPLPKVAELLEAAEEDLVAFYRFPAAHWSKLRSTNPLERLNKEIGRRSDVVGIFPNDAAAIRLVGALLIEQNDEWLVSRRYLSEESLALVLEEPGRRRTRGGGAATSRVNEPTTSYTTSGDLTKPTHTLGVRRKPSKCTEALVSRRQFTTRLPGALVRPRHVNPRTCSARPRPPLVIRRNRLRTRRACRHTTSRVTRCPDTV